MMEILDVVRRIAVQRTLTFADLVNDDTDHCALLCLDSCIEAGLLAFQWGGGDPGQGTFRLTSGGRRFLRASANATLAA